MSREPTESELRIAKAAYAKVAARWTGPKAITPWENLTDGARKDWTDIVTGVFQEIRSIDHAVLDIGCAKLRRASGEMAQAWQAMIDYMSPAQ